ncbi:hypothetical protein [Streptomyces sp. NPDC018833]
MSKKSTPGDGGHHLGAKGFGFDAVRRGLTEFASSLVRVMRTSATK